MSSSSEQSFPGIDPSDPKIQQLAAWAVNEYNKSGHCLKYIQVLKAHALWSSGVSYYIDLEASDGCLLHKFSAIVFVRESTNTIRLYKFEPLLEAQPLLEADARVAIAN